MNKTKTEQTGKKTSVYLSNATADMIDVMIAKPNQVLGLPADTPFGSSVSAVINKSIDVCYTMCRLGFDINDAALAAMSCGRFDILRKVDNGDGIMHVVLVPGDQWDGTDDKETFKAIDRAIGEKQRVKRGDYSSQIIEVYDSEKGVKTGTAANLNAAQIWVENILDDLKDEMGEDEVLAEDSNSKLTKESIELFYSLVFKNGRNVFITIKHGQGSIYDSIEV